MQLSIYNLFIINLNTWSYMTFKLTIWVWIVAFITNHNGTMENLLKKSLDINLGGHIEEEFLQKIKTESPSVKV